MDSPNIIFIRVIPDFTLWVEISRRSKVDEVTRSANVNNLTSGFTGLLTRDDCGDRLGCEGVASVDGDVMLCTGGFDFLKIVEVAGNNAVDIQGLLEGEVSASDIGGYLPIRVGLLKGSSVGS